MKRVWEPNMTYDGVQTYGYDPENRLLTSTRAGDALAAACDARRVCSQGSCREEVGWAKTHGPRQRCPRPVLPR